MAGNYKAIPEVDSISDVRNIRKMDPRRIIVLDTETTGTDPGRDEILSLTIVDLEGNVLFDELISPERRQRWPKAEEVNGISPAMVKGKRRLLDYEGFLCDLWQRIDLVVGYNVGFDTSFLYASGLPLRRVPEFDVMREFAPVNGQYDQYHGDYRWVKLAQCAGHYGITDFEAHTSLGDTEATRKCFLALMNDPAYLRMKNAEMTFMGFVKSLSKWLVGVFALSLFGILASISQGNVRSALFYLVVSAVCGAYIYYRYQRFNDVRW